MDKTVAIIGNGLTGITAAFLLNKMGFHTYLIGQKPHLSGGLQLASNGLTALKEIGLYEAILDSAMPLDSITITAWSDGRELADITHQDKRRYVGVSRSHYYQLLEQELSKHKKPDFHQAEAVHITCNAEEAHIILADGTKIHAHEVLGADGASGLCRSYVAGARLQKQAAAYYALRAEIEAHSLPRFFRRPQTRLILGDSAHFVSYPISAGERVNAVFCLSAAQAKSDWQTQLLTAHPTLKYLNQPHINWAKIPLFTEAPLANWRRGKVTLIGDAAHIMPPHLAQGAGQSFEDIAYLKTQLQTHQLTKALQITAIDRARAVRNVSGKAGLTGNIMRLSGLPQKMRDHLLGLGGAPLIENWLSDVWDAPTA